MVEKSFALRRNPMLAALERGETPVGTQMYSRSADLIEIAGYSGFDYVVIDMEHSRVDPQTLVDCIRAAEASGLVPLVRVAENNPALIRAAVESGAQGVVVPHVRNAAEAMQARNALRYPPEGQCGICPVVRSARYSMETWEEYMAYANANIMFIPLLEDVEAIEKAEEIIALLKPGTDAVGLGLADISNSLLKPGGRIDWQHPFLKQAYEKVERITRQAGIPLMGMPWPRCDAAGVRAALESGVRILIGFPDYDMLRDACRNTVREMKEGVAVRARTMAGHRESGSDKQGVGA